MDFIIEVPSSSFGQYMHTGGKQIEFKGGVFSFVFARPWIEPGVFRMSFKY